MQGIPGLPLRVHFGQILLAVEARLAKRTGISKDAVNIIGRNEHDVPITSSARDLLIRPGSFQRDQAARGGGGRINLIINRTLYVFSRAALVTDRTDRDKFWLTAKDGLFQLEEAVIDALEDWVITDQSGDDPDTFAGNRITQQGLNLTNGDIAEKYLKPQPNWGDTCVAFSVRYLPDVDPGPMGIGR